MRGYEGEEEDEDEEQEQEQEDRKESVERREEGKKGRKIPPWPIARNVPAGIQR